MYFATITQKRRYLRTRCRHDIRHRTLSDHMTAFGTGRWTHLHQMIHRGKHTGIMIDHNHRIAVSHQIAHHAQQSIHIRRMQSNRRFIQHIQHACSAVTHRTGQLHTLALAGGQCRTCAVKRQIA